MANNIELEQISGKSGAYKAGTIMATVQNGDLSHSQRVVVDGSALSTGAATAAAQAALLDELKLKADLTETQPVSAAALPLPTGAATQTTSAAILTELEKKADVTETQPVSAASLPLPTGAATSAAQATGNASLGNIETARGKLWDTVTSAYLGLAFRSGAPQILAQPYLQAIAEGDIPGHAQWEKIGFTPTMTTTESVVWSRAGAYVFPAAGGIQMAVASSSATGDLAAGAGCQQVTIGYLDANYLEQSETVTLNAANGTTRVNTVATNILRVNSFRVTRAGANGVPTGNIILSNTAGTVTYSYITLGYTRARNSNFCVPDTKTLYVTQATLGFGHSTNQTHYARMFIRANQNNGALVAGISYPFAEVISHGGTIPVTFDSPLKFVSRVNIQVAGIATVSGIATTVMRGWIE